MYLDIDINLNFVNNEGTMPRDQAVSVGLLSDITSTVGLYKFKNLKLMARV